MTAKVKQHATDFGDVVLAQAEIMRRICVAFGMPANVTMVVRADDESRNIVVSNDDLEKVLGTIARHREQERSITF